MSERSSHLASLLGSRICHDLISPLGAIGNGLELLAMGGGEAEMSLITESVSNANARIRFFRVAFGASGNDTAMSENEIKNILLEVSKGGRITYQWMLPGDVLRNDAKLAFLFLMCFETAMPYGGEVTVSRSGDRWRLEGKADKVKVEHDLWELINNPTAKAAVTPAQVQFALAADMLGDAAQRCRVQIAETSITVEY